MGPHTILFQDSLRKEDCSLGSGARSTQRLSKSPPPILQVKGPQQGFQDSRQHGDQALCQGVPDLDGTNLTASGDSLPGPKFAPICGVSPIGQVITHPHTPLGWKVGQAPGTMCTSCEGADVPGEPRAESTRVWGAGTPVLASPGLGW